MNREENLLRQKIPPTSEFESQPNGQSLRQSAFASEPENHKYLITGFKIQQVKKKLRILHVTKFNPIYKKNHA